MSSGWGLASEEEHERHRVKKRWCFGWTSERGAHVLILESTLSREVSKLKQADIVLPVALYPSSPVPRSTTSVPGLPIRAVELLEYNTVVTLFRTPSQKFWGQSKLKLCATSRDCALYLPSPVPSLDNLRLGLPIRAVEPLEYHTVVTLFHLHSHPGAHCPVLPM